MVIKKQIKRQTSEVSIGGRSSCSFTDTDWNTCGVMRPRYDGSIFIISVPSGSISLGVTRLPNNGGIDGSNMSCRLTPSGRGSVGKVVCSLLPAISRGRSILLLWEDLMKDDLRIKEVKNANHSETVLEITNFFV